MKKMKNIAAIFLFTLFCWGCENIPNDDPVFEYNKKSAEVITSNNNFGLEMLKTIIQSEEKANLMISPASISLALGMAYNGSETETKLAFESLLNYEGLTRDEVNEITMDLIKVLVTNVKDNTLEIANSIWYHQDFPVYQSFIDINKTYFDAEVSERDFSDPKTVDDINKWVKDKTHDKIEKIINELSPDARMVLINALYFNCLWEIEFDKDETKSEMFYNEDQTQFGEVDMMTTESAFNYASSDEFTAVELPYKNKKFSMHLFLPAYGTGLDELIEKLDGETWDSWINMYEEYDEVQVTLPKFKFDYEREMGTDLIDMGLELAFSGEADFSSISEIDLFISRVIHKTYIDLNEEGTEAAAVTAIVLETTSVGPGGGPIIVRFDRPFLFAITEKSSKSIVFIGKMMEPGYE
jgi:serpin B